MNDDQGFTVQFAQWLQSIPPYLMGPVMAFIVAIVRAMYDRKESDKLRAFLDAVLCGFLTVTAMAALIFLVPEKYLIVDPTNPVSQMYRDALMYACAGIGGAIGFIGAEKIRELALRFLRNKVK